MVGESGWGHRPAGAVSWPEKFQDLASYCHPQVDELNTPHFIQDEFNFSIDGQGHDCVGEIPSPGEIVRDPWETSTNISQLMLASNLDDENNMEQQPLFCPSMSVPLQQVEDKSLRWEHPSGAGGNMGGSFVTEQFVNDWRERESPIKSNGNLLLSQSSLLTEGSNNSISTSDGVFIKGRESFNRTARLMNSSLLNNENFYLSPHSTSTMTTTTTTTTASIIITPALAAPVNMDKHDLPGLRNEKSFYMEEEDMFKVPQISEVDLKNDNCIDIDNTAIIKAEKKEKPKLKLNIAAAAPPPQQPPGMNIGSLDTPDVISLTEATSDFDLLKYVNEVEFDDDEPIVFRTVAMGGTGPGLVDVVKTDHDYTGVTGLEVASQGKVKTEPPDVEVEDKIIAAVDDEEEGDSIGRGLKRRRSTSMMSQCGDEDNDDTYDSPLDASEEDSQEWSPYKKKAQCRSLSKKKIGGGNKSVGRAGKKRKTSIDSEESGTQDKYRELRNRNNEASRKSRLNRKQKELQMVDLANNLEKDNVKLKRKAENLQKLVEKLRDVLMNIVLKK